MDTTLTERTEAGTANNPPNDLISFNYGVCEVRTVVKDGEPWWVLKDVCEVLDIENNRHAAQRLDSDEVCSLKLPHPQNPEKSLEMLAVSESGLYNVIIRSDKPEAGKFRRWITHDILPQIRRSGSYSIAANPADILKLAEARSYEIMAEKLDNFALRINGDVNKIAAALLESVMATAAKNAVSKQILEMLDAIPDEAIDLERDRTAEAVAKAIAAYENAKNAG